jgi:uncharacterized protein with LGFP repeats
MTTQAGSFVVFGDIEKKWLSFGGMTGPLGQPNSNEAPTFDGIGREQIFQGGFIAWHPDAAIKAHVVWGLIGARWAAVGKEQFGYPVSDESDFPGGGKYNTFRAMHLAGHPEASIVWKPGSSAAWEVYGAIRQSWINTGSVTGLLHYPVDQERPAFDNRGRFQHFEGGILSWHPDISGGPFIVWGFIGKRWLEIGREQFGYPTSNEMTFPDGGKYNTFRAMHLSGHPEASIVWKPGSSAAWEVYGAIRDKWINMGSVTGALGYPVQEEKPAVDGVGRYQHYEHGVISWHPETGAHAVWGLIGLRWFEIGREQFGYPITDELPTPDGQGRFNHFRAVNLAGKPEASIYWTSATGAHEVYGAIRDRWAKRGWETSNIGYPIAAERDRSDGPGREQPFQHGRIVWSNEAGALFDPLVFTAPIMTGGLAALGGWVTVTVNLDGSVRWQGHAHDSGADGYDFGIAALVRTPSGRAIALAHSGHVGGTFTSGSRDHDWDETNPPSSLISRFLVDYNDGQLESHLEYSSDIGSALESAANWLVKFGVGDLLAPVGVVVFIGLEVGSLISTGSLVPGARVAEGVLWMAGPGNSVLAIAAEGIASLGSRTRELEAEWYDWANNEVFLGALPPRDRLVLTDTIGGNNRAFTFPRYDGKITLNMGSAAFDDPRNYPSGKYGQTFIHELVHACQIQHTKMDLALLADAFASKVCEATGSNPYTYGPAGPVYSDFNLEQQAQIVSDWFAGSVPSGSNQTSISKDTSSPYFRYINDNIRTGDI